jgi:hypothetical protein
LLAHRPGLEASQPSLALLGIARHFKEHDELDQDTIDWFMERFGHRGENELDPTAAVWNTQRPAVEDLTRPMASTDIDDQRMGEQVLPDVAAGWLATLPLFRPPYRPRRGPLRVISCRRKASRSAASSSGSSCSTKWPPRGSSVNRASGPWRSNHSRGVG